MQTLFENRRQALKLRAVLCFSWVACAAALYVSGIIYRTYGLSSGDGGVLRPFAERLSFAAFVAIIGVLFAGGMMVYASLYVLRIERKGDLLHVDTISPWAIGVLHNTLSTDAVSRSKYHHGRFSAVRSLGAPGRYVTLDVDAPWITMYVTGRRLPFLLDVQAERIDVEGLSSLLKEAVADWKSDRG
jgi:hypothetical protein